MTLIFNSFVEVVELHVRAKFYPAKFSGLRVIALTKKQKKN